MIDVQQGFTGAEQIQDPQLPRGLNRHLGLTTTEIMGSVGPGGVRFRGEARAGAADEAALTNLLNIIGRREGARSVISIG